MNEKVKDELLFAVIFAFMVSLSMNFGYIDNDGLGIDFIHLLVTYVICLLTFFISILIDIKLKSILDRTSCINSKFIIYVILCNAIMLLAIYAFCKYCNRFDGFAFTIFSVILIVFSFIRYRLYLKKS